MAILPNLFAKGYPFIIINTKLPLYFSFSQNPNTMNVSVKKVYQENRTIGGYVFEHWGKTPTTIHVEGIIRKDPDIDAALSDALFSSELFVLRQLFEIDKRKFASLASMLGNKNNPVIKTLNNLSDTILYYKTNIYTGFFLNFNYSEEGTKPYYNSYNFDFLATGSMEDFLRNKMLGMGTGGVITRLAAGIGLSALPKI